MDISNLPATIPELPPPSGVQSNFENPESLSTSLIVTNVVFLTLALLIVPIRFYVRAGLLKCIWWDDWTVLVALLASIFNTGIMLSNIRLGFGRHMWDIRLNTLTPSAISQLTSIAVIFPIGLCFAKLSIGFLYLRVFDRMINRSLRRAVYFIMAFCTLYYTANVAVEIALEVQCSDASASVDNQFCKQTARLIPLLTSIFNAISDIYLLVLPIPVITRLQMTRRRKCSLMAVLGAGGIACMVSIIRLALIVHFCHYTDIMYLSALTAEMTVVELNVGIVAASMVVIPKLMELPMFKPSTYSSLWSRLTSSSDHDEGTDVSGSHAPSRNSFGYKKALDPYNVDTQQSDELPPLSGKTDYKGFSEGYEVEIKAIFANDK